MVTSSECRYKSFFTAEHQTTSQTRKKEGVRKFLDFSKLESVPFPDARKGGLTNHGYHIRYRLCRTGRVGDRWPDVLGGVVAEPARAIQSATIRPGSEQAGRALQELH